MKSGALRTFTLNLSHFPFCLYSICPTLHLWMPLHLICFDSSSTPPDLIVGLFHVWYSSKGDSLRVSNAPHAKKNYSQKYWNYCHLQLLQLPQSMLRLCLPIETWKEIKDEICKTCRHNWCASKQSITAALLCGERVKPETPWTKIEPSDRLLEVEVNLSLNQNLTFPNPLENGFLNPALVAVISSCPIKGRGWTNTQCSMHSSGCLMSFFFFTNETKKQ